MSLSIILMIIGIMCIIISFFLKSSSKIEKEVDDLSIHLYQETNSLKRRLKIVEEELMLDPSIQIRPKRPSYTASIVPETTNIAPINSILVSQVLALHQQGKSIPDICKLSTLSLQQVEHILATGGKQ